MIRSRKAFHLNDLDQYLADVRRRADEKGGVE
jgi:hypothetical protein